MTLEKVTPCVGVWIEIPYLFKIPSLSSKVTPCVGVWIEIVLFPTHKYISGLCHSLRGSVD